MSPGAASVESPLLNFVAASVRINFGPGEAIHGGLITLSFRT
jgi:hypothetical protein